MTSNSQALQPYHEHAQDYQQNGFVFIQDALSVADMGRLDAAFTALLDAPDAHPEPLYPGEEAIMQLHGVSIDNDVISALMRDTAIADIPAGLFPSGEAFYWSEQIWMKQGGMGRRTPWHQDLSYLPFGGPEFTVLWIPLDPLPQENVLEVIRGSHKGTLFNGTTFKPDDDTAPLYENSAMPRLPDIERERARWDICSAPMARGDVLAFHPACLHGGAPTFPGQTRRSMSFRFFGRDARFEPRPDAGGDDYARTQTERKEKLLEGFEGLAPGDALCLSNTFKRVRPSPQAA